MSDSCDPMDCSATGSSVHWISQAKLLEWLPFPSPRDLPDPGIKPSTPSLQAKSLPTESSGRPISQSQRNEHNKTKTDTFATIQWHQLSSPKWLLLFSSVQSLSRVQLSVTPWIAACQPSLSITTSRSSPKLMSIKLVMPSNHLILWHPLLFLPPIPPSIRVFSNESVLHIRWPKYWSFKIGRASCRERV